MKLYLVRHGQSVTNLERRFTGWAQVPLTEQGAADARRAGKKLRGLYFDRIYSSDLIRAVQTAREALPGCEPVQLPELREINLGSLNERPFDECMAEYGERLQKDRMAHDFSAYGGENEEMLRGRVRAFLGRLESDPCDQAAAFSHAGFIQCVLNVVLGVEVDRSRIRCANGSVSVFEYRDGRWMLDSWNR